MAYTPKTWADGEAGGTPITAAELNRMETGIDDAHDAIDGLPEPLELGTSGTTAAAGNHTHTAASIGAAAASHTHTLAQVTDAGDAAGMDVGTASGTVAAGNHTHTAAAVGAASASRTHTLRQLTDAGAAAALDLGTAAGTVTEGNHTHSAYVPSSRTVNTKAWRGNVVLGGADVVATGYAIGTVALAAVEATDTLNAAIAKLEKRIADLEAAP